MDKIELIFLIFTIAMPTFFVILGIANAKRYRKSKKFRHRLTLLILLSLFINGSIYGGIKMFNHLKSESETKNETNKNDKVPNMPSESGNNDPAQGNKDPDENVDEKKNKTSKGYTIEIIDGVTYIDGFMIANKTYPLPETYVPTGTYKEVTSDNCQECIIKEAYEAYKNMRTAASNLGLSIYISSGYRSYKYQSGLYNMYVNRSGKAAADTFSARPGHSEHQTGYAFDLNSVSDAFANTKEGKWVAENCQNYGFIIRYPKGKEDETGYKYESWHLRFVGTELASKLYNGGDWITLEDYFGIDSKY